MNFKVHQNSNSNYSNFISINEFDLPENIKNQINIFEIEIVKDYLKKQTGRKGIKKLGNELRYNKRIKEEVFIETQTNILVKMTGNRNDFLKEFINQIVDNKKNKKIFLLIYEERFRKISSIVDSTAPKLKDIIRDLSLLFKAFPNHNYSFPLYIIEVMRLENYEFITDDEGFTKIKSI
jgi:hypothetical protein